MALTAETAKAVLDKIGNSFGLKKKVSAMKKIAGIGLKGLKLSGACKMGFPMSVETSKLLVENLVAACLGLLCHWLP